MIFEAQDIRFSYGQKPLLHDLSFGVEKNTIFCLTGPNGCGKTTLIALALRDLQPQSGCFRMSDKDAKSYSDTEYAKEIAFVPQMHRRTFSYTVREVIRMGRHRFMKGVPFSTDEDELAVEAVIRRFRLEKMADVPYTLLSGGELQMVLIARAWVQESQLLLMDEPTANLDIDHSLRILNGLAETVIQRERTVLFVSHDLGIPLYLEDMGCPVTLALLYEGQIQRQGVPTAVLQDPCLKRIYGVNSLMVDHKWENRHRRALLHSL